MPSKINLHGVRTLGFLFFFMLLMSCSYFFDIKEEKRQTDIASSDTQCLTQTSDVVGRFFNKLDEKESLDASLQNQINCLKNAVEKFSAYVKSGEGKEETYNAQEVLNVLNIFSNKEKVSFDLSLSFIESSLIIKEFLIGGDNKSITRSELQRIERFINVVGQLFIDIRPYRNILMNREFRLEKTLDEREEFDDAFLQLRDSINDILNLINKWGGKKPFDLYSAGEFVMNSYYGDAFEEKRPLLSLYIDFKKLVLNEDHQFIKRRDFDLLVHQTLRIYYSIFEYDHFVSDGKLFNGLGSLAGFIANISGQLKDGEILNSLTYESLGRIYERIAETLVYASRRGAKKQISMDKIEGLLKSMENVEYLGGYLTARSLTQFISNLTNGWMIDPLLKAKQPTSSLYGYKSFLTETKIKYIRRHIQGWQNRQAYINEIMGKTQQINVSDIDIKKLSVDTKEWVRLLRKVNLKHWARSENETEDAGFRLLFLKNNQLMNYKELTVSNSIFTESLFFMQPFQPAGRKIQDYVMNEDQTQAIYELMRVIGVELAFMDSRIYDTGRRVFSEANLFTTMKTPDDKLDLYEGFEVMAHMYNSGMLSEEIYSSLSGEAFLPDTDVLRKKLMKPGAFRKNLVENYRAFFSQLEGLSRSWEAMSTQEKIKFIEVLEKASRGGVVSDAPFDMGAVRILVAVSYYLESIFYNFESDSDNDEHIHGKELEKTEKHFHKHLLNIAELNKNKGLKKGDAGWEKFKEKYVDDVFYYILKYKDLPSEDKWLDQFWIWQGWATSDQKIERSDALHVFSILSDSTRKRAIERIRDFLGKHQTRLLHELSLFDKAPECHKRKVLFCQWARILQCNTDVYEHLYNQMKVSKNRFHSIVGIDKTLIPVEVDKTMIELFDWTQKDILLYTKCGYPQVTKDKKNKVPPHETPRASGN